ncbi:MAG: site-2 protease family protein [bacterium]|nr:site-2 protease family protein [bacterium]
MKWSYKIFQVAKIPIKIHLSFLLVLAILLYFLITSGFGSFLFSVFWIIAIFAVVIIHELTHSLVGKLFGYEVQDITLLPIGGMARMKEIPEKPLAEILVAVSGPMINVVIGVIGSIIFFILYGPDFFFDVDLENYTFSRMFISFNFIMAIFNLLPIFPMDGGRILRGFLALFLDYSKATHFAAEAGRVMAVILIIGAIFFKQFWLVLIGIFIFFGSKQEEQMYLLRHILSHYKVSDVYRKNVLSLKRTDLIFEIGESVVNSTQDYFPILDGEKVVGVITREAVFKAYYEGNLRQEIEALMSNDFVEINEDEDLFKVLMGMMEGKANLGIVYHAENFSGILTMREINNIYHLMKK